MKLADQLRATADEVDRIAALRELASKLEAEVAELKEARQGPGTYVDVRDFDGKNASDKYERAVSSILSKAKEQYDNPHVGGPGPAVEGFRGTSQLTLPTVFFPAGTSPGAGHYDFDRTMWIHPQVPVVFEGWNARAWFGGPPENYIDDTNEWIPGRPGPQQRGMRIAIAIANRIRDGDGREFMGYNQRIENINAKFDIGPCIGIGVLGHQHNARIINPHLVCDGNEARRRSVAIATLPSSVIRPTPWGSNRPSFKDPDKPEQGWSIHNQDMVIKDAFLEYWNTGAEVTGAGLRLDGHSYYTRTGFHFFGQSGFGVDTLRIDWQADAEGLGKGGWSKEESLAGIVRMAPSQGWARSVSVQSSLPVWIGSSSAPETRGNFKQGDSIW